MFHRTFIGLMVSVVASSAAPIQPTARAAPPGVPGTYELSFLTGHLTPIDSTLPVGEELVLKAHVTDGSVDAQSGAVTFQVCARPGGGGSDPGPSSDCDIDGTRTWTRLSAAKVYPGRCPGEGPGFVCVNVGASTSPRTNGYRFRYNPQGSGIAPGSATRDASWIIPAP